jgi:glyoxylase-like metal-dependent hydrolase (beta-lactamase superfamily II)
MADSKHDERSSSWRSEWGSAVEVDDGLWRIRLKNPRGTLQVNTYVHRGDGELVVIDPGWPWTLDALEAALTEIGVGDGSSDALRDVDRWLYTHAHIDHMGGAALLQERSDAPHFVWRPLEPRLDQWHAFQDEVADWSDWLRETFVGDVRESMLEQQAAESSMLAEAGPMAVSGAEFFELEDTLQVGSMSLDVVDARGHDPYHVAFFDAERGWLFSGDVVIAAPTPILRSMDDDLDAYRDSLARLRGLDADLLLPGHGLHRRGNLANTFDRSRAFVDEYRLGVLDELTDADDPLSVHEIGLAMSYNGEPLRPRDRWWVHLGLIDSHLRELAGAGRVAVVDGEPPRFLKLDA